MLALSVFLLCVASSHAQGIDANAVPISCANEIPIGVKVTRIPEADQHKVVISDFSVSASKNAPTYDLAMRIQNGTDAWCITSFALTYLFGDARCQAGVAHEYPAVMEFRAQFDAPGPGKGHNPSPSPSSAAHGVGMAPGKDQKRVVFDLYNYIQPRPTGNFDGFHLISAEIKYCMGYTLTKVK